MMKLGLRCFVLPVVTVIVLQLQVGGVLGYNNEDSVSVSVSRQEPVLFGRRPTKITTTTTKQFGIRRIATTTTTTTTTSESIAILRGGADSSVILDTATTTSLNGNNNNNLFDTLSSIDFLRWIDMFGTGLFAFSGALTAGRKGMDILGMSIIALITAVGGGTVRDLLFNRGPVFWLLDGIYIKICTVVTIATFVAWPYLEQRYNIKDSALPICYADAFCLGAFAVVGTRKAVDMELDPFLCMVFGLTTAVFGGVTRDILCLQRPRIMYPERTQYGGPPLLGSAVYAYLIHGQQVSGRVAACISIMVTFTTRVLSFNNPSRLPHWTKPGDA